MSGESILDKVHLILQYFRGHTRFRYTCKNCLESYERRPIICYSCGRDRFYKRLMVRVKAKYSAPYTGIETSSGQAIYYAGILTPQQREAVMKTYEG